jgi:hypothetical protein
VGFCFVVGLFVFPSNASDSGFSAAENMYFESQGEPDAFIFHLEKDEREQKYCSGTVSLEFEGSKT